MKTQAFVGVVVLAVGSAVSMVATGGKSAAQLPLPQTAEAGHRAPAGAGSSAGPAGSAGSSGTTGSSLPSGADPPSTGANGGTDQPSLFYITSPPVALTGCTVSVSDPAPVRGQTAESVVVSTTAGAEVRLEADYVKTRSVHSGIADGSGKAYFALAINHAQPGVTVRVTADVSLRGAKDSCSTSFTPVYPAGILPAAGGGQ
jgi:hypothetical protein